MSKTFEISTDYSKTTVIRSLIKLKNFVFGHALSRVNRYANK